MNEQRVEIVQSIKFVDEVIPEDSWDQKVEDIEKYSVDLFAIGNDWEGKFDFLNDHCKVCYLERTDGISTTELKKSLQSFLSISRDDLMNAFDVIEMLRKDLE